MDIEDLFQRMMGGHPGCHRSISENAHLQYDLKTIGKLSEDDAHEFRIISANGDAINKECAKLMCRRQELDARSILFWAGVRRKYGDETEEFMHLNETKDGIEVQTGPRKERPANPFADLFPGL